MNLEDEPPWIQSVIKAQPPVSAVSCWTPQEPIPTTVTVACFDSKGKAVSLERWINGDV